MPRRWLIAILGAAAGTAAVAYAARRLDAVAVRGLSMAPALLPGDRLLVVRHRGRLRPGHVVVVSDPRNATRELVKRVSTLDAGRVSLLGDNRAESTDTRVFGPFPASAVRWRAVLRYWPPSRIGFVPSSISTGSDPAAHALSG